MKWSQWDQNIRMIRCGDTDYHTIMNWMSDISKDAKRCLSYRTDKNHSIYGRKIYDKDDTLKEIRFYCNTYYDDNELDKFVKNHARDILYVSHK